MEINEESVESAETTEDAAEEVTDEALVADYNANDNQDAFLTVYQRYCDRIAAAVAGRLTQYRVLLQDVDEVVQKVFLDLHRNRHRFDPTLPHSTVRAFLFKAAERRAKNHIRDRHLQKRDDRRLWGGGLCSEAHDGPELPDKTGRRIEPLVRDMVESLPEPEAAAVRLKWLQGHTYSSAGEILNLPASTVQSRVRAGLQRLRERFSK